MTGFMYLHETKEAYKHVKALNYLTSALKLSKEEQANFKLVSNSKAAIINYGLLDLPADKVKENEDKILHSV
jgi:hypothetical protein